MTRGHILPRLSNFFTLYRQIPIKAAIFVLTLLQNVHCYSQALPMEFEWQLWKKSAITEVYFREISNSDLIEIKAKAKLSSTLSGFILFLQDTDKVPLWLDNAKESYTLRTINSNQSVIKIVFESFWPINGREMVINSQYRQNKDFSLEIDITNATNDSNIKSDNILVDVISAQWLITPITAKELFVEYTFIVDPKGIIPLWIVNRIALKSTWKTLENIQQQLPLSKWQLMTSPTVNEIE